MITKVSATYVQLDVDGRVGQEKRSARFSGNQSLQETDVATSAQYELQSSQGRIRQFDKLRLSWQLGQGKFGQLRENEVLGFRFASDDPIQTNTTIVSRKRQRASLPVTAACCFKGKGYFDILLEQEFGTKIGAELDDVENVADDVSVAARKTRSANVLHQRFFYEIQKVRESCHRFASKVDPQFRFHHFYDNRTDILKKRKRESGSIRSTLRVQL